MKKRKDEFIWEEAYRPTSLDDIILTESWKSKLRFWIKEGQIPNLLFASKSPGTGKSSLAHVLIHELGCEAKFINASKESNIDVLKSTIQKFAHTGSGNGMPKIVVLDEADGLNERSTQPALRQFIEEFSKNIRFIFTANTVSKIIDPLRDRLEEIDFDNMFQHNTAELIVPIAQRSIDILNNENIDYDVEDIKYLVKRFYPSTRSVVRKLQIFSTSGKLELDKGVIDIESDILKIIQNVINKEFGEMRKNITKIQDTGMLYSEIYKHLDMFPVDKQPLIIITIAKYQANDGLVRDRLVNVAACLTELIQAL